MNGGATLPPLIDACLSELWSRGGTDLLLTVGSQPFLRIDGRINRSNQLPVLGPDDTSQAVSGLLGERSTTAMKLDQQADFAFDWRGVARVRGNAFVQRQTVALSLRLLPLAVPSMAELRLPTVVQSWTAQPRGLVLTTGPSGAGKSTTLASMLNHINTHYPRHIITIEDPIEYVYAHRMSAVNQREVGVDTPSFAEGLRAVLREDPDVVLIGEMRDVESIQAALTIAETGHLVLATLHTNDSSQALDRITDVFPGDAQPQVRLQLAHTLLGVAYQNLVPRTTGGRVAAFDVLVATEAVRNLIREGRTRQIRNVITTSQKDGMQSLEASLSELVATGLVSYADAVAVSMHPGEIVRPG
jgi:twitching motility protein PilT